jgi:alpha-glucosidase
MKRGPSEQRWWQGAVLYQLYVRSWADSDADGYGDLRGIISRLDHLEWLGVDGIWLSPTMPSPDEDWGYDVSDYTGVHPELGILADLDELVAQAGRRGLKVLLDLVPNHTSSAHPWFIDAASGRDSAHRDYYVWADPAPDGGPPNNWLDSTGQTAWAWDAGTGQYYLHNYLPSQPDLNWWLPDVHEEFRQILDFWFDRGVAGFRIDVAHGLYKDAQLRDNPALPAKIAPYSDGPGVQHSPELTGEMDGRFGIRPVYNANQPEVHGVFRDWRKMADRYSPPRLLLGETWVHLDRLAQFYGHDDEMQLAFNFPFVFAEFTADGLADVVGRTLASLPAGDCPVWMASNHDVGRFPTRWCGGDDRKTRLALLVLATLPGTVVLYYGDEIGMPDVEVPPELQRDGMTMGGNHPQGNRDRARTPMQWDESAGGGFTTGTAPWLPLGETTARNVSAQRADPGSVLCLCRDLVALRRTECGPGIAPYEVLTAAGGLWAYRVAGLTVLVNLSGHAVTWPGRCGEILLSTGGEPALRGGGEPSRDDIGITLDPWQGVIARSAD